MHRLSGIAAMALAAILLSPSARAGAFTDDLTKCIVKSTSDDDKVALMQWVFMALAAHPSMKKFTNVTPDDQTEIDKRTGALFIRLVTSDCRKEAVAALKYEGSDAFKASFSALGEIAMQGLMANPQVMQSMDQLDPYIDKDKMQALATEAGVQDQTGSSTPSSK
jgi:hypothetical protein